MPTDDASRPHAASAVTDVPIPFLGWLGARLVKAEGGQSEIELTVEPHHCNSWNVCHGGVLMTMLDAAMATAARSLHPELRGSATVDMTTSFVRPGQSRLLKARGKCYHRSSTMAFCEAEVRGEDGGLVARSSGTFKYIKKAGPPNSDG